MIGGPVRRTPGRRASTGANAGATVRRLAAALGLGALAAATAFAPRAAGAQETACDPGDVEVVGLDFSGNHAFSDATLAQAVATTPSSWLRRHSGIFGTRRCIEPGEVRLDQVRLGIFYRRHGYPDVRVDTLVREVEKGAVMVGFRIAEGAPLRLRQVTINGLDSVPERAAIVRNLRLRLGDAFDQTRVDSVRDQIVGRLHNGGYPFADALRSTSTSLEQRSATVTYDVTPGPRVRVGRVVVSIEPRQADEPTQISARVVRRIIGVRRGDLYRASDLNAAQRELYRTDAYDHVDIRLIADSARVAAINAGTDSTVDVGIALLEQRLRSASLGGGLGTLDCFRVTGEFTDRNIGHQANRLDVTAQVSKIGIGRPLNGARGFCQGLVRLSDSRTEGSDPYSDTLNYRVATTFQPRALFGLRTLPSLTLFSEVRSEYKAYLRRTPFGAAAALDVSPTARVPATLAYQYTLGRTSAAQAFFCAVFSRCDEESRNQVAGGTNRGLGTLSLSAQHVRTNAASDPSGTPSRGIALSGELRHASRITGSDPLFKFSKATGDGTWYVPVIGGGVLAARGRVGSVFGATVTSGPSTVPTEERLYAGGPNSVRGYGQNELGPVVYTVTVRDSVNQAGDTVLTAVGRNFRPDRVIPVGGNTLAVANLEYRSRRFADNLLQYVVFTDVGQVWNRGKDSLNLDFNRFRVTPGAGVRVYTTLGFTFRLDVGYNGYRREDGVLYYTDPIGRGNGGQVYCVSADEITPKYDPVTGKPHNTDCHTFRPRGNSSFLSRLTPSFSIGQAF